MNDQRWSFREETNRFSVSRVYNEDVTSEGTDEIVVGEERGTGIEERYEDVLQNRPGQTRRQ